jgi:glycosyltransferase involved in cell wall biosynthesis
MFEKTHVYVCPSRGEGWGMQTHEAMGIGRPVIGTRYSGILERLTDAEGWPVRHRMEKAGDFYGKDCEAQWACPDAWQIATAMLDAYHHPEKVAAKGEKAAEMARSYTWEAHARKLVGAVVTHMGAV